MPRVSPDPSVARLAAELLAEVDPLADELAARIAGQIEIYRRETHIDRTELKRGLIDNMTDILGQLSGRHGPNLEAPRQLGRVRAAQGAPLPEILRAYRLGFAFVWQRLLDAARRRGQESIDALIEMSTSIWELADDFALAMTESYREAMSEQMIAADRRRSGIVSAVLGGAPSGLSAWEVAKLLDLPYEGSFLVLVAEAPSDHTVPLPGLADRLRTLAIASAWRSQPDHEIGVLSLIRRRAADDLLAFLAEAARARVGLSPEFDRLDGAARALRLARVALETLPLDTGGVRQLTDEPLTDLLVRDLDTTRRFVLRVLGKVLALSDDDRATLLATAEAWIAAHGSAAEAGRVLYCHENTVRHRLRRLGDHLGVSLDDPRNLADLTTALQAIRTFPQLGRRPVES